MREYEMEELLPIVAELSRKYTSNESTSITYDRAKILMEAVLFCIHELQEESKNQVADTNMQPEEAYQLGYELVKKKVKKSLELYNNIMIDFQSYHNRALYDTVVSGMPEFFRRYDAAFSPQDKLLTLDYPTIGTVEHLQGIDAIYQYLIYIQLEQEFLNQFPETFIIKSLEDYHEEYKELFINIPSVVLRYFIQIVFSEEFMEQAKGDRESFTQWTKCILKKLIDERFDGNTILYSYLEKDLEEFGYYIKGILE